MEASQSLGLLTTRSAQQFFLQISGWMNFSTFYLAMNL